MQEPLPLPEQLEPILEAQLLANKQSSDESNALLGGILAQSKENNAEELLATQIGEERKNTDKIVESNKESADKVVESVESLKPVLEESAGATSKMSDFLSDMKGEK